MRKLIYVGTTYFSAFLLLKFLRTKRFFILAVLTGLDNILYGCVRFSVIKKIALLYNLELHQLKCVLNCYYEVYLRSKYICFFFLSSYPKKIPSIFFSISKFGWFNLHPSLLPNYKGSTPIENVILNGNIKSGVTIHILTNELDTGSICMQKFIFLNFGETSMSLEKRLLRLATYCLNKFFFFLIKRLLFFKNQLSCNNLLITKRFRKQDALIDWNKSNLMILHHIKSFQLTLKAFSYLNWQKLIIFEAVEHLCIDCVIVNNRLQINCGEFFLCKKNCCLLVRTKESFLRIVKFKIIRNY